MYGDHFSDRAGMISVLRESLFQSSQPTLQPLLLYFVFFLPYKFTCEAALFSITGSVEITEGISLFSQPSPVDKCKEGVGIIPLKILGP